MSRRRSALVESEVQPKLSDGEIPFEHRLVPAFHFDRRRRYCSTEQPITLNNHYINLVSFYSLRPAIMRRTFQYDDCAFQGHEQWYMPFISVNGVSRALSWSSLRGAMNNNSMGVFYESAYPDNPRWEWSVQQLDAQSSARRCLNRADWLQL